MESKKPIEILAEVIECTLEFVQKYADAGKGTVSVNDALEAMKIFGKQCFDAAKLRHWATDADTYTNFDEYIKELEVRNEKVR